MVLRGRLSTPPNIEGEIYRGVGGGSTVSITPVYDSGTKIADYEIDGTEGAIYIPNSTSAHETIWTNNGTTNPSSITLDKNLNDYDIIIFSINRTAYGQTWKISHVFDFKYGINLGEQFLCDCWSNNNEYLSYVYSEANKLTSLQQGNALVIDKIIGVKV